MVTFNFYTQNCFALNLKLQPKKNYISEKVEDKSKATKIEDIIGNNVKEF